MGLCKRQIREQRTYMDIQWKAWPTGWNGRQSFTPCATVSLTRTVRVLLPKLFGRFLWQKWPVDFYSYIWRVLIFFPRFLYFLFWNYFGFFFFSFLYFLFFYTISFLKRWLWKRLKFPRLYDLNWNFLYVNILNCDCKTAIKQTNKQRSLHAKKKISYVAIWRIFWRFKFCK